MTTIKYLLNRSGRANRANCVIVRTDDNCETLFSYGTPVLRKSRGKLERLWDGYSVTTMSQINQYLGTWGMRGISKKEWQEMPVIED